MGFVLAVLTLGSFPFPVGWGLSKPWLQQNGVWSWGFLCFVGWNTVMTLFILMVLVLCLFLLRLNPPIIC